MSFAGRTLAEYFVVSRTYLALMFVFMAIVAALRLLGDYPSALDSVFSAVGILLIGLAGWNAVRRHGFNLAQAGIVGVLLSLGTHWALPLFHPLREIFLLASVNTILYALVAAMGGWMAKALGKLGSN